MPSLVGALARIRSTNAWSRLASAFPAVLQIAAAITVSFSIAHYLLGHQFPALSCTVALSSLTLNRDARPRRVAETAFAMVMGITLSATIVTLLGRGPGQIALIIVLVLTLGTLLSKNPAFAISAGTQSMLVAVLQDPAGGPYMRAIDGSIGGLVALASVALLPRAPFHRALQAGKKVVRELADATHLLAAALTTGDPDRARQGLTRLRALSGPLASWNTSLESARAVAAFSPLSRSTRAAWLQRSILQRGVEAATHDLRALGRRVTVITRTGRPQPRAGAVVQRVATAVDLLATQYPHHDIATVRSHLDAAIIALSDASEHQSVDAGLIAMSRLVVVDCLTGIGVSDTDAHAALPTAPIVPPTQSIPLP
jgi:uncharacterized membrane protein YgaE (UPF0421/DUF939 family)